MDRITLTIFAGMTFFLVAACSSPGPQTGVPTQAGTIPTPPHNSPPSESDGTGFCWSESLGGYFAGKKQCDPRYDSISASEFRERREAKALTAFFEAHPDAANENYLADRFDMVATGTAFFVTEDGYLITNKHVVQDCDVMTLIA
jgi:S1-C subfamily serine protease